MSLAACAQTTPSYKNVKLTQLPLGTKNDSIVLTNGSTKLLKYIPVSQIKVPTNLDYTATPTGGTVFSSTGNDAVIPLATITNAGLFSPTDKTTINGVQSALDLKANDADVLHKTGNETKTGTLTINNPAGGGSYFTGTQSGSGADRFLIKLFNNGSVNSAAIRIDNQSDAYGFNLGNNSTGIGGYIGNNSDGTGFKIDNSSMGVGLILNNGASATGYPLVIAKSNVVKSYINDSGDVNGAKFVKSGGTSSQFLKADGSVDSNNYIINNTAITGATNTKITYDSKGLVTSGTSLVAGDIPNIAQSQVTNLVSDLALKAPISSLTNTQNYLTKYGATGQTISRVFDTGTYLGIGTANTPSKDLTFGNQADREIGIEESTNVVRGRDLIIKAGRSINFVPSTLFTYINSNLAIPTVGVAVSQAGNVYVAGYEHGIWMQTAGTGNFQLIQSGSSWSRNAMFSSPNGDVYWMNRGGVLMKQAGGTGTFTATAWSGGGVGIASYSGDIYIAVNGGDIYKQTNGTGSFVALGQTSRAWSYMTATPNGDIHASDGTLLYTRLLGSGNFVYNTSLNGYALWSNQAGELFTVSYGNPLKKLTTFGGTFTNTGENMATYDVYCSALAPNGNIYISFRGDLLIQNNFAVGTANLNGGNIKMIVGTGKGTGDSSFEVYTGQKTVSGTDMQSSTLRLKIDNEGHITSTTMPVYADNTAALAGGLTTGKFYRTSTGTLMIVY